MARSLRRARTCSWVVDGNSEDIEQMRGIVQVMLAGNPCAQAARAELEAGASDESVESMQRAMRVLVSENCEVTLPPDEEALAINIDNEEELEVQLELAEQQAQEVVDEAMDSAMNEGSSLIDTTRSKGMFSSFFRTLAVLLMVVFLLLACSVTAFWISAFIALLLILLRVIPNCSFHLHAPNCGVSFIMGFGGVGSVLGFVGCAYTLVTQLLPADAVTPTLN